MSDRRKEIREGETASRPIAVVTGASSGIGYELAKLVANAGFDLVLAADEPRIYDTAVELRKTGAVVNAMQVDLSSAAGVSDFLQFVEDVNPQVDLLIANAGTDRGGAFVETDISNSLMVIDLNVRGTVSLIHSLAKRMSERGTGKILITASIVSVTPGPYHAIYCASKAFLYSFAAALRYELKEKGVSVTCLMPGVTDTAIYQRAGMQNTPVGRAKKADPASVAEIAFKGLMANKAVVVPGTLNRILVALAGLSPSAVLSSLHGRVTRTRR